MLHSSVRCGSASFLLAVVILSFSLLLSQVPVFSGEKTPLRHGITNLGELKYPPDFPHFDYVNPQAPKGGKLRMATTSAFTTLNPLVPKGITPSGLHLIYDTLMAASLDEPSSSYGLLASGLSYPDTISSVTYVLRPEAKWHDGTAVTADDVIFSFKVAKEVDPTRASYYADIVSAEKLSSSSVLFKFKSTGNRELPSILGQLQIFPKHWWTGKDGAGVARNIAAGTLEPTLGSGPYRIKEIVPGRHIVYERVKDYWAKDLPVMRGHHNIDEIRYEVYRDDNIAFEAFKAGDLDVHAESQAKRWAIIQDLPAVKKGLVILEKFERHDGGVMQAYVFNLRRDKFKDRRVRRAFNYAFNFESMNNTLFHGQYSRINSYFQGTELASSGLPQGAELGLLDPLRSLIPPDLFTTPWTNPVGGDAAAMRENLRKATALLDEAGWGIRDGSLTNRQTGEVMTVEFIHTSQMVERVALSYKPWLERLGITVQLRMVDPSQYIDRIRNFDFDITTYLWPQSLFPGNEQRNFFGSVAADQSGSQNVAGIKNAAVDTLIEKIIFSKTRDELVAATKALDRVLLWNDYVVPHFTASYYRFARWDRFSYPTPLPRYSFGFPDIWWYNSEKEVLLDSRR